MSAASAAGEAASGAAAGEAIANGTRPVGAPLWLLLELTYRCPLHCVFCYNPTEFAQTGAELNTAEWLRVLREARALGAVQLGLSGGEPLVREDLEEIVADLERTFGVSGLAEDVNAFVTLALEKHWLELRE